MTRIIRALGVAGVLSLSALSITACSQDSDTVAVQETPEAQDSVASVANSLFDNEVSPLSENQKSDPVISKLEESFAQSTMANMQTESPDDASIDLDVEDDDVDSAFTALNLHNFFDPENTDTETKKNLIKVTFASKWFSDIMGTDGAKRTGKIEPDNVTVAEDNMSATINPNDVTEGDAHSDTLTFKFNDHNGKWYADTTEFFNFMGLDANGNPTVDNPVE